MKKFLVLGLVIFGLTTLVYADWGEDAVNQVKKWDSQTDAEYLVSWNGQKQTFDSCNYAIDFVKDLLDQGVERVRVTGKLRSAFVPDKCDGKTYTRSNRP